MIQLRSSKVLLLYTTIPLEYSCTLKKSEIAKSHLEQEVENFVEQVSSAQSSSGINYSDVHALENRASELRRQLDNLSQEQSTQQTVV